MITKSLMSRGMFLLAFFFFLLFAKFSLALSYFNITTTDRMRVDTNTTGLSTTVNDFICPINGTSGASFGGSEVQNIWGLCQNVNGSAFVYYTNGTDVNWVNGSDNERLYSKTELGVSNNYTYNLPSYYKDISFMRKEGNTIVSEMSGNICDAVSGTPAQVNQYPGIGFSVNMSTDNAVFNCTDKDFNVTGSEFFVEAVFMFSTESAEGDTIIRKITSDGSSLYEISRNWDKPLNFIVKISGTQIAITTDEGVEINKLYHVIGTFDGVTTRLFVNGVLNKTNAFASPQSMPPLGPACIGGKNPAGNDCTYSVNTFMRGYIDYVAVGEKNLSSDEVKARYDSITSTSFWAFGAEENINADTAPTITIDNPKNSTFQNATLNFNFTVSDTTDISLACWYALDTNPLTGIGNLTSTNNVVGYWKFNETSGTVAYDSSLYGNNGTISGASFNTSGKYGGALSFDGLDDYVNVPHSSSLALETSFTLEAWVKLNSIPSHDMSIIDKSGTYYDMIVIGGSGKVKVGYYNGTANRYAVTTEALSTGTWYHIAGTWDGSVEKVYLNGIEKASLTTGGTIQANSGQLSIGNRQQYTDKYVNGTIDEVRIWNKALTGEQINHSIDNKYSKLRYNTILNGLSAGQHNITAQCEDTAPQNGTATTYFTVLDNPPVIAINSPANSSSVSNYLDINFTPADVGSPNLSCWYAIDKGANVTIGINNLTNNQSVQLNVSFGHGFHQLDIRCEDDLPQNTTENINFTTLNYNVRVNQFDDPQYETNTSTFVLVVDVAPNVADINATLVWNNLGFNMSTKESNTTQFNFTRILTFDLLGTGQNNTNFTVLWNYTIGFSNGTTQSNLQTNSSNQTLLFAYYISGITWTSDEMIEGEYFSIITNITKIIDNAFSLNNITFNNSVHNTNLSVNVSAYATFAANFTLPNITEGFNYTFAFNSTVFFTHNGITRNQTFNGSVFVYRFNLTDCSLAETNTVALNFTLYDEKTPTVELFGDMDITMDVWRAGNIFRNFSFDFNNGTSFKICIYPSFANLTANATIQYFNATTHPDRNYYLVNAELSGTANAVNLYLLHDDSDTLTKFVVKDSSLQPKINTIVKIQRYYIDTNTYRTVAMVLTDEDGEGITRTETNTVFYKFLVEENGVLLKEFSPTQIEYDSAASTNFATVPLTITEGLGEYFSTLGKITSGCTYNNATDIVRCTATDVSNLVQSYNFTVEKRLALSWTTICSETSTDSAVTFTCDLGSAVNNTFRYKLTAFTENTEILLQSGYVGFGGASNFAMMGLFSTFILFLGMITIGLWNPSISLLLGGIALFASYIMGIISLNTEVVLAGLLVVLLIFALRSRTWQ